MKLNTLEFKPIPFEISKFTKLSLKAFDLHYNKHHASYVNNLKNLELQKELFFNEDAFSLIEKIIIIKRENEKNLKIYNNLCQHYNHTFFWESLTVQQHSIPENIKNLIFKKFGGIEYFIEEFNKKGASLFGSGWIWIVYDYSLDLIDIINTSNADLPNFTGSYYPLLVCDVWEHAYYVDYENRRIDFLKEIFNYFNWNFAQNQLSEFLNTNIKY